MFVKLAASLVLFVEVLVFAMLPYSYSVVVTDRKIISIFNNFSAGLFLGISFLHIIPEANQKIDHALGRQHHGDDSGTHEHSIPIGSLISVIVFLLILAMEVYFHDGSGNCSNEGSTRKPNHKKMYDTLTSQKAKMRRRLYFQTILVQFALSTHSFFECLSIGIESSDAIAYTLTFAIVFHKWAEALTLGFSYYASGMSRAQALKFALFHSFLNAGAVLIGLQLSSLSGFINGMVNGISGGTFIYVCMIEKINKNFQNRDELFNKMLLVFAGLGFSCLILI